MQRRIRTTTSPGTRENAVSQSVSRNCLTTNRDLTPQRPCVCDTISSTRSSFLREHPCGEFFQTLPNVSSVGVLSACLRVLARWEAPGHHLPRNRPLAHLPLARRRSRRQSPSRCRRYVLFCMAVHLPLLLPLSMAALLPWVQHRLSQAFGVLFDLEPPRCHLPRLEPLCCCLSRLDPRRCSKSWTAEPGLRVPAVSRTFSSPAPCGVGML